MTDLYEIDTRAEDLVIAMIDAGIFKVDGAGRIWRVGVRRGVGPVEPCERRRAEYRATNGYLRLRVSICGVRIRVSAHRIVYRYVWGEIPAGHVIDHVNRKRDDNRPRNLEAVTQGENVRRAAS